MSRAARWTLALAAVGGFVDAVGFLTLFHLFTAHMSGNSVWFGAALGSGQWRLGLHHLFPIPLFVLGLLGGTVAVELAQRRAVRARFVPALLLEIGLLGTFMAVGSIYVIDGALQPPDAWAFYALAAAPPLAMGLQNATLRQVAGRSVHTTYVTGVLQGMSEALVQWGMRRGDAAALRTAGLSGLVWLAYVVGAIGGGAGSRQWALLALILPLVALAAAVAADFRRPLDQTP